MLRLFCIDYNLHCNVFGRWDVSLIKIFGFNIIDTAIFLFGFCDKHVNQLATRPMCHLLLE